MKLNGKMNLFLNGLIAFFVTFSLCNLFFFLYKSYAIRTVKPTTNSEYSATSVMITRYDGRAGGTGVIVSSEKGQSKVLTNAHVCGLLNKGGIVRSDTTKAVVKAYQISNNHDLCLITTNTNFRINTVISDTTPDVYDDAIVSGHPHLLPNIITRGHFSQKEIINILTGFLPCTEQDLIDEETSEYCKVLGIIPIIKSFEAQVVSATIMPGSSGSAVFNANGEISGLVFAGSGEFGYGLIVPQEYISTFFELELPTLPMIYPNREVKPTNKETTVDWKNVCLNNKSPKIKTLCDLMSKSLLLTH
jgi:S1-C subfamily serine protease